MMGAKAHVVLPLDRTRAYAKLLDTLDGAAHDPGGPAMALAPDAPDLSPSGLSVQIPGRTRGRSAILAGGVAGGATETAEAVREELLSTCSVTRSAVLEASLRAESLVRLVKVLRFRTSCPIKLTRACSPVAVGGFMSPEWWRASQFVQ